jgi:TRAP transporter 4TM/12TM fusion protein
MSEIEPGSTSEYRRWVGRAVAVIGVAMSLYHAYAIAWEPPAAVVFRTVHLSFAVTLVFLIYPMRVPQGLGRPNPFDFVWLIAALTPCLYLLFNYEHIINRIPYIDDPTPIDIVMASLSVVTVLEGTRRIIGWALPITAMVFIVYALVLTDVSVIGMLDQLYLTQDGIFGSTLGVSATFVIVFVLFGSFMERTGTGQLFMDFALSLTGHTAGGPGKVSVISSSLFGTISGSAVANVMVDGPITIPLMKRTGFRPPFAAAVEAVASTGGQIMPPVMGAAAFVMAEYLQVSYFQVTIWALIPSLLYYVACFAAVHFEAKRQGLLGLPRADCPRLMKVLGERGHLFIPVFIILYFMFAGYSAPLAALVAAAACFPVAMLRKLTRNPLRWHMVWDALVDGAKNALSVAMACACAGIVIGVISLTGLGITFTQALLGLAQNSLLLALLVTAVAGIILGMGMPTTPAYIVMVSLLVPAIIKLGAGSGLHPADVMEPAAHMFAFYFAILSAITPPVALAVFAAASLAKADLWESGWAAVRVGAAGFIVPFMFVYEPALLMIGDWDEVVMSAVTASAGCILLAAGLHGYLLRASPLWERTILVVAALCLIKPGWITDLIGIALAGVIIAIQLMARERKIA